MTDRTMTDRTICVDNRTCEVERQPQGGVIVVSGIEISDEEGTEGGSGFDVNVDGWGEYEDIELPL